MCILLIAMDAVTDFCAKLGVAKLNKFMVAGASKRGWTTWTTVSFMKNKRLELKKFSLN